MARTRRLQEWTRSPPRCFVFSRPTRQRKHGSSVEIPVGPGSNRPEPRRLKIGPTLEHSPMVLTRLPPRAAMAAVGQGNSDWYESFPAYKVVGNTYYVGSKDLATYLITTPEGHIL